MLEFLRRHQRYFFFVITVVIIISFSFFGTYSTLTDNSVRDQVVFTAINGQGIKRSDVDEMAMFLATDNTDKLLLSGAWGPNFLNDGVIRNDLLETGMAEVLVAGYLDQIRDDLLQRFEKEKRYALYAHPEGGFVSVANAWNYFAPGMHESYLAFKNLKDPATPQAFAQRVQLYLQEQRFPAPLLKQVLKLQEKQYSWITPDPIVQRGDFSLFGYHTTEDWFGQRFTRLAAEFIINASIIAEQKGYQVSKAEALTDLVRNNDISYQQNKDRPNLGVANPAEYFQEQLRRMGMDTGMAVKIWQQVMQFRRMFHDVGYSVFLDTLPFQQFNGYAKEYVELDMYQLPHNLQLSDFRSLQKFETYLNAVTKRSTDPKAILLLPKTFLASEEVAKKYPELVQKKYLVEIAKADKKVIQGTVTVKETWNWEVEDANWAALKKEFPELGVKKGNTRDDRFASLDSLDDKTRSRVDAFARNAIVNAHPEWIQKALQSAAPQRNTLAIRLKGENTAIAGLEENPAKQAELIKLLDQATLSETPKGGLESFSADDVNFYAIRVIERSPKLEILTFAEANRDGTLDKITDQLLKTEYPKVRETNAKSYQNEDGSWKEFKDVKDAVAKQYFDKIVKAVNDDYAVNTKEVDPKVLTPDFAATNRFFAILRESKAQVQKNPEVADVYHDAKHELAKADHLTEAKDLKDQWLLEKLHLKVERNGEKEVVDQTAAFAIPLNSWSKVDVAANGSTYFYKVLNRGLGDHDVAVVDQTRLAYSRLADDAQRMLMRQVVQELRDKNALSLDYLNQQESPGS